MSYSFAVIVLLAVVTAQVARSKGHPAWLWFLLGLLLPVISLLVAAVLGPRRHDMPLTSP